MCLYDAAASELNMCRNDILGGKSSGIFGEPAPSAQPQRPTPPGGPTSNIFGAADTAPAQSPSRSHPNKPKVGGLGPKRSTIPGENLMGEKLNTGYNPVQ